MNLDELRSEIDMRRDLEFKYSTYAVIAIIATVIWVMSAASIAYLGDIYASIFIIGVLFGIFTIIYFFAMAEIEGYRRDTLYHIYSREKGI